MRVCSTQIGGNMQLSIRDTTVALAESAERLLTEAGAFVQIGNRTSLWRKIRSARESTICFCPTQLREGVWFVGILGFSFQADHVYIAISHEVRLNNDFGTVATLAYNQDTGWACINERAESVPIDVPIS